MEMGPFRCYLRLTEVMRPRPYPVGHQSWLSLCLCLSLHVYTQAKRGHSEKAAICKSGREASSGINPVGTLMLNIQPPELSENKILLFKLPSRWILLWQPELTLQLLSRLSLSSACRVFVHPSHPLVLLRSRPASLAPSC